MEKEADTLMTWLRKPEKQALLEKAVQVGDIEWPGIKKSIHAQLSRVVYDKKLVCTDADYPDEARLAFSPMAGQIFVPPSIANTSEHEISISCGSRMKILTVHPGMKPEECKYGWQRNNMGNKANHKYGQAPTGTFAGCKHNADSNPKAKAYTNDDRHRTDLWTSIATDERFIEEISDCCPRGSTWGMTETNAINADKVQRMKDEKNKGESTSDQAAALICFRSGRGSQFDRRATATTGLENLLKPELTKMDGKTRDDNTPVKCATYFKLQIFECKDCTCTKQVDGKKQQQLVQFHTHHSLKGSPASSDLTCTPWFVYVDGMIRNMISKLRKKVIDSATARCKSPTSSNSTTTRSARRLMAMPSQPDSTSEVNKAEEAKKVRSSSDELANLLGQNSHP